MNEKHRILNDVDIQNVFKAQREEKREEAETQIAEYAPELANMHLDDVIRGLSDACEDFSKELLFSISYSRLKINPMTFRIRLPDPAFYFIEHGSPFIFSLLGEVPRVKDKSRSAYENYIYQVRTCCASLRQP